MRLTSNPLPFLPAGLITADHIKTALAVRLAAGRQAAGLTQKQLAGELGLCRATIYNYEAGTTEPSVSVLCKLAARFGQTLAELLGEDDEPTPPTPAMPQIGWMVSEPESYMKAA